MNVVVKIRESNTVYLKIFINTILKRHIFLYVTLCLICIAGVLFRVNGYSTHVTYIDELICLTEGRWNSQGAEHAHSYDSAWDYATKMASNKGVTYAPLQFLLTHYFVKSHQPLLSLEALSASRLPSVIFGCLSIGLLLLLFYVMAKRKLSYSCLLPLTLLTVSSINIVNSQQNHTYIFGVLAFILVLFTTLWLSDSLRRLAWLGSAVLLAVLPFSNYQVTPIVILAIGIIFTGVWVNAVQSKSSWKFAAVKTALLVPGLATAGCLSLWLLETKATASIPWWVGPFSLEGSSGESWGERIPALFKNLGLVVSSVLNSGENEALNNLSLVAVSTIALGGLGILISQRFRGSNQNILPVLLIFAVAALFVILYLTNTVSLSPSRHTLILTPAILVLVFYFSSIIENSRMLNNTAQKTYQALVTGVSITILVGAALQYPEFSRKKTEAFQANKVIEASEKTGIRLVAVDWWTYDKAYILLREHITQNRIRLVSVGNENDFPKTPFLLIGQNTDAFMDIFKPENYKSHSSKVLHEHDSGYDFEPSKKIKYWPNKLSIYLVSQNIP